MNAIEQLRNKSPLRPFREVYEDAPNKKEFLEDYVKYKEYPNLPSLLTYLDNDNNLIQIHASLYPNDLQDKLFKIKEEREKMKVILKFICYNNYSNFQNLGGTVSIGLNFDIKERTVDENNLIVIKDNPIAQDNSVAFSALKSKSSYNAYIFHDVKGEDVCGVYHDIYYKLEEYKQLVKTYTIVTVLNGHSIREVTLHDFGKHGNILTEITLGVKL